MDIKCTTCGEPWEMDILHEIKDEHGITYDEANRLFRKDGCEALESSHNGNTADPAIAELAYLLGDDVDGLAATLEDFGL